MGHVGQPSGESSGKRGKRGERQPAAQEMSVSVSFYRLGIRIRQALMVHDHTSRHMAIEDCRAVDHSLSRLLVAVELLSRTVPLGSLKERGEEIVREACREWQWVTLLEHDIHPTSGVGARIQGLEVLYREFVASVSQQHPEYQPWFELGCEIVELYDAQPQPQRCPVDLYDAQPGPQRRPIVESAVHRRHEDEQPSLPQWAWQNQVRVEELLERVGIPLEQVFPELGPDDPVYARLPILPERTACVGWYRVEAGLRQLEEGRQQRPEKRRPTFERDHQFLAWYEDRQSELHGSYAKIRDHWNQLHPGLDIKYEAVKKAIQKAKRERELRPR